MRLDYWVERVSTISTPDYGALNLTFVVLFVPKLRLLLLAPLPLLGMMQ